MGSQKMHRGPKIYKDGVKPIKFARVVECSILCEIEA